MPPACDDQRCVKKCWVLKWVYQGLLGSVLIEGVELSLLPVLICCSTHLCRQMGSNVCSRTGTHKCIK